MITIVIDRCIIGIVVIVVVILDHNGFILVITIATAKHIVVEYWCSCHSHYDYHSCY